MRGLALLVALLAALPAWSAGISIERGEIGVEESFYQFEAFVNYDPSEALLEALNSGVPMIFQVQLKVQRTRAPFWQYPILERRLPYQLRYHALASVYELIEPEGPQVMRFATLAAALRAMGTIDSLRLIPLDYLDPGHDYELTMEVKLDIESLPVPLRPLAYLSSDWTIHQETHRWPLPR